MRPSRAQQSGERAPARRAIRLCFFTVALIVALTRCAESVKHDEVSAAKSALEFARVALLEKNIEKSYAMLSEGGKRHVPRDKFKQTIAAMHPRDYPNQINAREFEPMAGEKAIYIFLVGRNEDEQFSYRVTLEGTAATGYKVLRIDQGMTFPTLSNQKQSFKPALGIP